MSISRKPFAFVPGIILALTVATLALSGVAQADTIISGTVTGIITGGEDGGLNGANDSANIFGGGNLYGDTVTMSFSYDTDLLNLAFANCIGDSVYESPNSVLTPCPDGHGASTFPADDEFYYDGATDSAITVETTINGVAFSVTNSTFAADPSSVEDDGSLSIGAASANASDSIGLASATEAFPEGQLENPTAVQDFLSGVQYGDLAPTSNDSGEDILYFTVASSATPEPATWFLAALGFSGVALMKRNRSARR